MTNTVDLARDATDHVRLTDAQAAAVARAWLNGPQQNDDAEFALARQVVNDGDGICNALARYVLRTAAERAAVAGVVAAAVQLTTMRVELPIDNAALVRILADVQELEVAVRAAGLAEAVRA